MGKSKKSFQTSQSVGKSTHAKVFSDMLPSESFDEVIENFKNSDRGKSLSVIDKLAEGGMGIVYRVLDENLMRFSAMKVLYEEESNNQHSAEQFIEEARITGQLEHPNIVPLHVLGISDNDKLFFTMKLIEGEPLSEIVNKLEKKESGYSEKYNQFTLLSIFRKVCDAVHFAHSKNIVHRDIKPENIMVGKYGEVLLLDWGIAKYIGDGFDDLIYSQRTSKDFTKTIDGIVKGSPAYMSPEQSLGEHLNGYDAISDIFLLGATLYHLMTYKPPYMADDIDSVLDMAEAADFTHPAEAAPSNQIPDELCEIIMRAMATEKKDRYQTVHDLINDIDSLMSGHIMSTKRIYKKGDLIIQDGETGNEAFVIEEGLVEVFKRVGGKRNVLTQLKNGDVFGEMAAITNDIRSASVEAIEETKCLVITADLLTSQLKKMPPWLEKIVEALVKRLRDTDELIHPLLVSDCTFEVLNQLKLLFLCHARINNDDTLEHELQDIICEIANNLKLPENKIRWILAAMAENNLVCINDKLIISIPNWNIFSDFVDYTKSVPSLTSTSTKTVSTVDIHRLYTDGSSVVLRHTKISPKDDLRALGKLRPIKDKLSEKENKQIRTDFAKLNKQIKEYALIAELTNQGTFKKTVKRTDKPARAPSISTEFNKQ